VPAAAAWSRRHVRALVVAAVALLLAVLGVAVLVTWHFSSLGAS